MCSAASLLAARDEDLLQDVICFFVLPHMTRRNEEGRGDPQTPQVLHGPEVIPWTVKERDRDGSPRAIPGSSALDRLVEGDDFEVTANEFDLLDEVFQELRTVDANVDGSSSE